MRKGASLPILRRIPLNELLEQIKDAESQAEQIRLKAAEEARGILKSVEEACAASARQSQKAARDAAARLVEEARVCARDEINQLSVRRSTERELLRGLAQRRIPSAAAAIVERIVGNGDR